MSGQTYSAPTSRYPAYAELVRRLLPESRQVGFLDVTGTMLWGEAHSKRPAHRAVVPLLSGSQAQWVDAQAGFAAVPIFAESQLAGWLLLETPAGAGGSSRETLLRIGQVLAPLVRFIGEDLALARRAAAHLHDEIEWLLAMGGAVQSSSRDLDSTRKILVAVIERMKAVCGTLVVPEWRVDLVCDSRINAQPRANALCEQLAPQLLRIVARRAGPLLATKSLNSTAPQVRYQIMAVPVARQQGSTTGVMAFMRPAADGPFDRRELTLARHIAHLIGTALDHKYDVATGLLTRAALEEEAMSALQSASAGHLHAVAYINIDRLHVINESLGFDAGDWIISQLAALLRSPALPLESLAARISGDCFAVLFPEHSAEQAQKAIQGLQQLAQKLTIGPAERAVALSLSCGIAELPRAPGAFSVPLGAAELACRTAKDRGRNRCEIYLDVDDSMMRRRSDITSAIRLRAALEKGSLVMFGQRIVALRPDSPFSGIECLVRLVAEDGQIVPPCEFMPAAERYQLITQLDEWVLRHVLQIIAPYAESLAGNQVHVAINLSGQSLSNAQFLQSAEESIIATGLPAGLLVFEITENAAISQPERTNEFIRRLRRLGCRFALDDFGTGVNSLSNLKTLRVNRVKLDGTFVRDVVTNPGSEATVRAVLQLARAFGMDCVAEFVETPAIADKLRELGVDYAQGNAVHLPQALPELLAALSANETRRIERALLGL